MEFLVQLSLYGSWIVKKTEYKHFDRHQMFIWREQNYKSFDWHQMQKQLTKQSRSGFTLTTSNGYVETVAPSFATAPNKKTYSKKKLWHQATNFGKVTASDTLLPWKTGIQLFRRRVHMVCINVKICFGCLVEDHCPVHQIRQMPRELLQMRISMPYSCSWTRVQICTLTCICELHQTKCPINMKQDSHIKHEMCNIPLTSFYLETEQ